MGGRHEMPGTDVMMALVVAVLVLIAAVVIVLALAAE
jgi:hypothetical protein